MCAQQSFCRAGKRDVYGVYGGMLFVGRCIIVGCPELFCGAWSISLCYVLPLNQVT